MIFSILQINVNKSVNNFVQQYDVVKCKLWLNLPRRHIQLG